MSGVIRATTLGRYGRLANGNAYCDDPQEPDHVRADGRWTMTGATAADGIVMWFWAWESVPGGEKRKTTYPG
ncbi:MULTISPECIES: hypothetical protein [unclassified Sorangium]|uniref:Uncharacterized protein n=1 Tax=Sorangium cellulosum TaxID=56 RepID=A0A150T066_SORCE|nr:hypothetical protein BE18_32210 [Sorangium cellulosum]KYF98081.1 hypothetical protein BE20_36370 [Sorangium cellulosum]